MQITDVRNYGKYAQYINEFCKISTFLVVFFRIFNNHNSFMTTWIILTWNMFEYLGENASLDFYQILPYYHFTSPNPNTILDTNYLVYKKYYWSPYFFDAIVIWDRCYLFCYFSFIMLQISLYIRYITYVVSSSFLCNIWPYYFCVCNLFTQPVCHWHNVSI